MTSGIHALRYNSKSIGVAEYQIAQSLPANLEYQLPSIERIGRKLEDYWRDDL